MFFVLNMVNKNLDGLIYFELFFFIVFAFNPYIISEPRYEHEEKKPYENKFNFI